MKKTIESVNKYLTVIICGIVMGSAVYLFIQPNSFAPSGISGLCVIVQYVFNFSVGYLYLLANIPIAIMAFILSYKKFAVRSYVFCLVYSLTILVWQYFNPTTMQYNANGTDTLLPVLIAGAISGTCTALTFNVNASQCGTEVISRVCSERMPEFNFFYVTFALNASVAVLSLFVYAERDNGNLILDFKPVALCVLFCLMETFTADTIMKNQKQAAQIIVVTDYPDYVLAEVSKKTYHSATMVRGTGTFSGEEKAILIFIVNKYQTAHIKRILKKIPRTFSYITPVSETVGHFDSRKVKKIKLENMKFGDLEPDHEKLQ